MSTNNRRASLSLSAALAGLWACSSPVEVDVQIVNPCDADVIDEVDFLRFEPRGTDIDSEGLSTIVDVTDRALAEPIAIPLTTDFRLVVTGHKGDPDSPIAAIGVSAATDLTAGEGIVPIRVPFALVDSFYRTTDLTDPETCSGLAVTRFGATATYMPASGTVLVVGGEDRTEDGTFQFSRAVELYNPADGSFSRVAELPASLARAFHTATLLADGRVLIAGGESLIFDAQNQPVREALRTALIIDARDPAEVKVDPNRDVVPMQRKRTGHTAARLADGRVVVAGGRDFTPSSDPKDQVFVAEVEIFDPDKRIFLLPDDGTGAATVKMAQPRAGHSGLLLGTGRDVLFAGGYNSTGVLRNAEILRFADNRTRVVTSSITLGVGALFHAASLLDDGRILFSGGYDSLEDGVPPASLPVNASNDVEMWEFRDASGQLGVTCRATMTTGRGFHTQAGIGRSNAVFMGGRGQDGMPHSSAEVVPLTAGASCFASTPKVIEMGEARTDHVSVGLGSGEVLVVGGRRHSSTQDIFGSSIGTAEVFSPARNP